MSVYARVANHGTHDAKKADAQDDDEWETEPDYVNDVSEKAQRWGSKLIVPEKGEVAEKGLANIRNEALAKHNETTKQEKKTLYGGQ